jgi:hypothetical protein
MAIVAITSIGELERIATQWDSFVIEQGPNPFFLSGYLKQLMVLCRKDRWSPVLLVRTFGPEVTGIAAFKTKRTLGVRTAEFLLQFPYSPDFLASSQHRQSFIMECLDFLVCELGCQLIELVLPDHSPNVTVLNRWSASRGIAFWKLPPRLMAHAVLPVQGTYDDFSRARGKNFNRRHSKIERKLREVGEPYARCIEIDSPEVVTRTLELERRSWKAEWRRKNGIVTDDDLDFLFGYSSHSTAIGLRYCPKVWFLELNGEPIAYVIVTEFKKTAFFVKTSYDKAFSSLYPGESVQNIVLRELFDSNRISIVDFLTKLPYHRKWTTLYLDRERVRLCKRGLLSVFLLLFDWSQGTQRLSNAFLFRNRIIDIP